MLHLAFFALAVWPSGGSQEVGSSNTDVTPCEAVDEVFPCHFSRRISATGPMIHDEA